MDRRNADVGRGDVFQGFVRLDVEKRESKRMARERAKLAQRRVGKYIVALWKKMEAAREATAKSRLVFK